MATKKCFSLIFSCFLFLLFSYGLQASEPKFLPVEKAFLVSAKADAEKNQASFQFNIAKGYMLYKEHIKFKTADGLDLPSNAYSLPEGILKKDEVLGNYEIYQNKLDVVVALPSSAAKQGLQLEYQGCAEEGFCYPPQTKQVTFSNSGEATFSDVSFETPIAQASETDSIASSFMNQSLLITLLTFLGAGILLAFTPCVLPMVPILANIIVGQKAPTKKRSIFLASLYVLSVACCYAFAGLAAGLLGSQLQASLQQPHFLMTLGFLILLFAGSQLNFIHFEFPRFITEPFQKLGNSEMKGGGSALGAVGMGAVSALMASPCVTPALIGALTYITQTGDGVLGGLALFALGLGMGLPLLVVASIGSHLLPKAGNWMVYVKNVTGVLLLVLAGSIFMRAMPSHSAGNVQATAPAHFIPVQTLTDLSSALNVAKEKNKFVILDVYADWCVSCRQMDKEIFENQLVLNNLKSKEVSLLRLDLTNPTPEVQALKKQLDIIGPPMVLFFGPDGQEIRAYRAAGKMESNHFLERVNTFLNTRAEN